MAVKTQTKYRGYIAQDLKDRASIPSAANITVNATTIDCKNISLTAVKNLISCPTFNLASVCKDSGVNVWSGFGPTLRSVSAGVLVNSAPTDSDGYYLGSFAGYNDSAITPHIETDPVGVTKSVTPDEEVHWEIDVEIGEPQYVNEIEGYESAVLGIAMSLWSKPGGNLLFQYKEGSHFPMAEVIDINSVESLVQFGSAAGGYRLRSGGATGSDIYELGSYPTPYTGTVETRIELIEESGDGNASVPEVPSNYDPASVICRIPGVGPFDTTLRAATSSSDVYHNTGYTATFYNGGWDYTTGHINCEALTLNHTYATYLKVDAWVEQYNVNTDAWERVTSIINLRDPSSNMPYTSGEAIVEYYDVHHWTELGGSERAAPVPSYDYRLYINYNGS